MKKLNRVVSFLLVVSIILSSGITASAKTKFVPAEQIVKEIVQIYEKYDVTNDLIEYDDTVKLTRKELDLELEKLDKALAGYNYYYNSGKATVADSNQRFAYTKTYTTYANLSNGVLGNATIELKCNGTINDSTISFISISNISTRQYGSAFNFVSWTQTDSGYSYMDNNTKADVWAEGTLVTEANIAGQVFRTTLDHGIVMIIQAQ